MTKKDFTFPFFYKEWLVSTTGWDADARGWYISLLCHQADKGMLPADAESLAELAGVKFSQFERFKIVLEATLKAKFEANEQGMLENKVMSELLNERKEFVEKRSHSGVVGTLVKKGKALYDLNNETWQAIKNDLNEFDFTNLSISEREDLLKATLKANMQANNKPSFIDSDSDNNSIDKDKSKTELYPTFEDFWNCYDKKTGSIKKIKPKWERLRHETKCEIMEYIPHYIASQPEKQYRKNPETFLNNEGWKDEIIKSKNNDRSSSNSGDYSEKFMQKIARGLVS